MDTLDILFFSGTIVFFLVVVVLLYQRKKRKEAQIELDFATLVERQDWQGVRRILRKQLWEWGILSVLVTIGLAYCITINYRVLFALISAGFIYYYLYQEVKLYITIYRSEKQAKEYREITSNSDKLLTDFKNFMDCRCTMLSAKTDGEEIMKTFMQTLERGRKEGFWPLLIYVRAENLSGMVTQMNMKNGGMNDLRAYREKMLNFPLPNARKLFDQWLNECISANKDCGKDWQKEIIGEPTEVELDTTFLIDDSFDGHLLLAEVPVKEPWQLLTWCPCEVLNPPISATQNTAVAKYLYEHYKVIPAFMDYQLIDFIPLEPIPENEVEQLTLDLFSYCPDWIYQDFFNLSNGKKMIKDGKIWTMLWSEMMPYDDLNQNLKAMEVPLKTPIE